MVLRMKGVVGGANTLGTDDKYGAWWNHFKMVARALGSRVAQDGMEDLVTPLNG